MSDISWKLRWGTKAWRNVASVPTTSPSARWFLFLFLNVSFPTDWFKGETTRNPHADQYISHVPYQPFFCKIWKTSDFQTQFNTPTVSSIFDFFLGLNTAWSLRMPDGRIATQRFRNIDMVPLESIFQTCMFCNLSLNGSVDHVRRV